MKLYTYMAQKGRKRGQGVKGLGRKSQTHVIVSLLLVEQGGRQRILERGPGDALDEAVREHLPHRHGVVDAAPAPVGGVADDAVQPRYRDALEVLARTGAGAGVGGVGQGAGAEVVGELVDGGYVAQVELRAEHVDARGGGGRGGGRGREARGRRGGAGGVGVEVADRLGRLGGRARGRQEDEVGRLGPGREELVDEALTDSQAYTAVQANRGKPCWSVFSSSSS